MDGLCKVLVAGGARYKGVVLTQQLLDRGHKVTILDNFRRICAMIRGFWEGQEPALLRPSGQAECWDV